MKNYNQAPLPFQGQKRRFIKQFKDALKGITNTRNLIVVDLFGGSGLLSHVCKKTFPEATVIWNDFDNYQQRLVCVDSTNVLLQDIRAILKTHPEDKKVEEGAKEQILNRIRMETGFVDYVTISGSLIFSGKYATSYEQLKKETFYAKVKKSDYDVDGYLEGVNRVQVDYKELFLKTKDKENVIYLIDPPYLSTDCKTYSSDLYWKLSDYLDVLNTLQDTSYFYFTSNKSHIIELCNWISNHSNFKNPFKNSITNTTAGSVNYNSNYTDIMCYKLR